MNRTASLLCLSLLLAACNNSSPAPKSLISSATGKAVAATPRATCGPGSRPETGLQGRVSVEDHETGRAAAGFTCNTERVGSYTIPNAMGTVGGFKVERYVDKHGNDCAYYDTTLVFPTNIFDMEAGVNVLDMKDPANPVRTARLVTPAMLSPHESLVISTERGVLAAVTGNPALYPGIVDVYDLSEDCRTPALRASAPVGFVGHESGMAPDGKTFYSASPGTYSVVAVDISNPMTPTPIAVLPYSSHGLSISADGNRAYIASIGAAGSVRAFGGPALPDNDDRGLIIVDVSEIQARVPGAQGREVSRLSWTPMSIPQNAIPITIKGRPYVIEIDEYTRQGESGAGRIIDISDETRPQVISDLRLEVHSPENFDLIADDPGADGVGQGYAGHYCNVPTRVNPTIVACSMIVSGLRVFDIRDPRQPREVAYFNAPVNPGSFSTPSNFAMSSPAFVPERKEIWYTDANSGFYVVRVTNKAWPD